MTTRLNEALGPGSAVPPGMAQIDVLKAKIVRAQAYESWGFSVSGGTDQGRGLHISRVEPGGQAESIGVRVGDEITAIGDRSTQSMSHSEACNFINQHVRSIILTIERVATNCVSYPLPTLSHGNALADEPVSNHLRQSREIPIHHVGLNDSTPTTQDFQTAIAKPYTGLPAPRMRPVSNPGSPCSDSAYPGLQLSCSGAELTDGRGSGSLSRTLGRTFPSRPGTYHNRPPGYNAASFPNNNEYSTRGEFLLNSDEERLNDAPVQSRTFRMLQNIMENKQPAGGVSALPPPRSATYEKMKAAGQQPGGGGEERVKVMMAQQYNTPMGLYSAQNVMDTFTRQAGSILDNMERKERYTEHKYVSNQQATVYQQSFNPRPGTYQ